MNKILMFFWLAVFAVLLIENMVMAYPAYVLWFSSSTYILVSMSTVVWFVIWFWVRWLSSFSKNEDDQELDF